MIYNKIGVCFNAVVQLIVWALVIAFFSYVTYFNVQKLSAVQAQQKQIQEDIQQALMRTEELNKEREYVETDEFVEKVAREQLGLVKPDERIFIRK